MKNVSRFVTHSALAVSFFVPFLASAQIDKTKIVAYTTGTNGIISVINGILVPVLIAIAFITFLWGVYKYFILGATEEKSRTDGKQFVLWGIIGFVVILSVWALVTIVKDTFNLTGANPTPPTFVTP